MMKTIKRPISIILTVMLVVGMFSILPFSASAAEGDYYVVGTMTNPAWSINEAYKLSLNPNNNNEYMITDVILPKGTQIKIAKEGENNAIDTWYPDGTNNNYTVDADGVYTIYFKPVSEENIGWHYGLFYPVKTADLDLVAWNGYDTYYTDLDEAVNDNVDSTVILLKDIGDYTPTFTGERLDLDEISIYFNTNNHSFNLQEPQGYALQNGLPYGNEAYVFRKAYLSLNGQNYDSYGYRYVYDDEGYCFIQIGIGADYFDADNDPVIDALGDVAVYWIYGIPDDAVGETILVRKNGHTVTLHDGANANGSKQYVLVEGETDNGVTPYTVSEVIFQASPSYERFASFAEAVSYYNSSNTGFIDQKANCNEEYTIKTTDRSPIKVYHNGYTGLTIKAPQGYELVTSTTDNLTSYSIRLCTHSDLTAYPAVDKNCTTAGNSAYWKCNNCGKYFSDEEGQNEISYGEWVIPAGHTAVNHPAVAATYNAPGNIEYWECAACGKYFADEEMTQEIAAEAVVIPMLTGAVAQVGETKYGTFAEAVTAANGTETITLLANAPAYVMTAGETLKVAKNGFTFNKPTVEGAYVVDSSTVEGVTTYTTVAAAVKYTNASDVVTYYKDGSNLGTLNDGTYQLLADVTRTQRMAFGLWAYDVTIDLNGHTLTSTANDCAFTLGRAGSAASPRNFAIVDTSTNKGGKLVFTATPSTSTAAISVGGKFNNVTIGEGATVEGGSVALLGENQSLTVNGTINGGNDFAVVTNGAKTKDATITINNGAVVTSNETAMYLPGTGTTTINGGTITGATAIYTKSGTVEIKGGTITGNGDAADYTYDGNGCHATGDAVVVDSCGYPGGTPVVTISGNPTITSTNGVQIGDYTYQDNAAADVTSTSNELTLPEGLKWVATETEGVYEVGIDYAAEVNGTSYMTFEEAVAERATNDDVITLLKNYDGTYTMAPGKLVVDKNGCTFAKPAVQGAYIVGSANEGTVYTFTTTEAAIEFTSTAGVVSYKSNIDYSNMGSSGTYKLLKDITCNSRIVPGLFASNVTVDLNGHTLTSTDSDEAFLFSRAGSAASHNSYTITNGTIIAAGDGIQLLANNADLTLDGVTVNAAGNYGIVTNGTKTGNNITVTDSVITADDAGIYKPSNGTLTLTDTTVEGKVAVYVKSGTVAINGGTFTGTGAKADYTYNGNGINPTGDAIVIDSCGYPGGAPSVSIGGNPTITSTNGVEIGDYAGNGVTELAAVTATDNSLTLPEGLKWVATETEGVYEVGIDYAAEVNGTSYMTFEEAVAERATNDDVITLLKNYDGTYTMAPGKLVVDKNGCTFAKPAVQGAYIVGSANEGTVYTFTTTEAAIEFTSTAGVVSYKSNIDYSNMGSSGTYKLLKDITCNSRIVPGLFASNVTVDLNGHTLTSTDSDEAFLFSRAGSAASHNSYTITNGTIIAAGDGIQLLANNADLTLDGVTVNAAGNYGIVTNGTKTGNNITVTDSVITADDAGIYKPSNGTLTLTDTTVEGKVAVYVKSGTVAINGGTFTGTGAKADYTYNGNGINPTGDAIVIDSCGYPGGAPSVSIGGNPTITSTNGVEIGDYMGNGVTTLAPVTATDNTLTLPEGLRWVETDTEGVYTVTPDVYVLEFATAPATISCGSTGSNFKVTVIKNGTSLDKAGCTEVITRWTATISDDEIAEITTATAYKGYILYKVKGKKVGNFTISLVDSLGLVETVSADSTVINYGAATLSGTATNGARMVETGPYTITGLKFNYETVDPNDYTFESGDPTVATVDGLTVTPLKEGSLPLIITSKEDPTATYTQNFNFRYAAASIGDNYYPTLSAAMIAAANNDTIVVLKDLTESVNYSGAEKAMTLDLNGHTITGTSDYTLRIDRGTLTVKDSSTDHTGAVNYGKNYAFIVGHVAAECTSKLILESGNFTGKTSVVQAGTAGGSGSNRKYYGGTVEILGGTFVTVPDTNETYDANGNFKYTLNKLDYNAANYPGGMYSPSEIIVKGGSFVKFDPENNSAEGANTNVVANGFKSEFDGEDTYTVVPYKLFTGHSLSLNGDIAVNFFLNDVIIRNAQTATVTFTCDKYTFEVDLKACEKTANGYLAPCNVPVAFMAHNVHAVVTLDGVVQDETNDYSVQQYAEVIIGSNTYPDELKTLCKEMLNYGKMAQEVFKGQMNATATYDDIDRTGLMEVDDVTTVMIEKAIRDANDGKLGNDPSAIAADHGAKYYTTTLNFLTKTTLRHYYTKANGNFAASEYNGNQSNYYYYVEKADIPAAKLDEQQVFTVGDDTFTYSALDYALAVLNGGANPDAQRLVKAMYLYNQAANAFFTD